MSLKKASKTNKAYLLFFVIMAGFFGTIGLVMNNTTAGLMALLCYYLAKEESETEKIKKVN